MDYEGVIIEESLQDATVLKAIQITGTKVEPVTLKHHTPWLTQWTLHTVTIPAKQASEVAERISESLAGSYWYADFKNNTTHYVIFPGKVFVIDRTQQAQYQDATTYGLTLGIPSYQLDFTPNATQWEHPTNG